MRLHHAAVKVPEALFDAELTFYADFLGLPCVRRWANGALLAAGEGHIELLKGGDGREAAGALHHFALEAAGIAAWAEKLRRGGYEITRGPERLTIAAEPPAEVEIVFFRAPAGETIELYCEL